MTIKENLYRIGFLPTMRILCYLTPNKKTGWRPPQLYALIGAMSSFFISGLIHEWMILVLAETPTTWESMIFFIIHGALTTAEVIAGKLGRKWLGYDPIKSSPKWLSIPITYIVFLCTAPFFLNPWVRDQLEIRLHFPLVWDIMSAFGYAATQ
jgi:hypothetical protein